MAARRLLIVLVLLLAASVGAAALAPDRRGSLLPEESSTTTSTVVEPTGAVIAERIDASAEEPETVRAEPGDQLELTVGVPGEPGDPGRTIAIDEFGVTGFAAPEAPARFDLLLRDAGRYAITDGGGDVVGRIVVSPAPADQDGEKRDGEDASA